MKSLQNKYNLIKEGKGNKELFIKEARAMFPNVVTGALTFDQAIHNLTERGIISEGITGVLVQRENEPNWFKIFNENTEKIKSDLKKTDKSVEEKEIAGYDYEDKSNNNNISTAEILKGYYAEMKDPKNADKTEEELKKIVFKNLEKDPLHYVKDGAFGIKGIGYTEDHPGLGPTKEVTGKYKSSGMEPVKLNEVFYGSSDGDYDAAQEDRQMAEYNYDKGLEAYGEGDFLKAERYYTTALRYGSYLGWTEQELPPYEEVTGIGMKESYDYETQADLRGMANEEALAQAIKRAKQISDEEGVVQHVNRREDGSYEVSDWYDSDNTVFSYQYGRELEEADSLEEDKVPGSNIKKVGDKWRILSGKTGKMWKAHYDTKEDAEKGLKAYFASQHESLEKNMNTLTEAKKRAIEKHLKEIEKLGEVAAYEYKANKVQEKIEELKNKLAMTESDDMKEMVDKNTVREIKKDIAVLEKKKKMYEAQKAKAAKRVSGDSVKPTAAGGEEIIDEAKEKKPVWQEAMKSVLKKKGY